MAVLGRAPAPGADAISPVFWRRSEIAVLEEHYPLLGAKGCARRLTHRSAATIRMRAHLLGIRKKGWGCEK